MLARPGRGLTLYLGRPTGLEHRHPGLRLDRPDALDAAHPVAHEGEQGLVDAVELPAQGRELGIDAQ